VGNRGGDGRTRNVMPREGFTLKQRRVDEYGIEKRGKGER
jgi:hypothetical protein